MSYAPIADDPRPKHHRRSPRRLATSRARLPRLLVLLTLWLAVLSPVGHAEYGDVVLNKRSEQEGMRPVIFPHWFHRIRFRCKVCHHELGFEMRAGANDIDMAAIVDGRYCGMCHNGTVAWSVENCDLCHSGLPGLETGIVGGHQTTGPGRW